MKPGPYESEGHRDRCAMIGRLVSMTLDMRDASPREIEQRVELMAMGLRIIATWASCDGGSDVAIQDARFIMEWLVQMHENEHIRFTAPDNIIGLCRRALKLFSECDDRDFDEAEPIPMSKDEIDRIVKRVTSGERTG